MNDSTLQAGVQFEERDAVNGLRIGFVRLSRPRQMNALTLEMCDRMRDRFADWASDEAIACVVLTGEGERAFCSGGDVVAVARAIREGDPRRFVYGDRLLAT